MFDLLIMAAAAPSELTGDAMRTAGEHCQRWQETISVILARHEGLGPFRNSR
ncbi:hypothetical protein AB0K16_50770 [Nonomuraea jabiensis]|uniref:hypothetical protein n=1 Tax=Nonomuraea jabiensis TaxID=882448 RepID=UPI00343AE7C2